MILGIEFVRGSGNVITREYDVKNFRAVKLAGIGNLTIEQTGEESLRIEAEDNILDVLRVEVRGDELYLGVQQHISIRPTHPINYHLTVRDMEEISVTGSGNVQTSSLQSRKLTIGLTGSGDLDAGRLSVERDFSTRITGSGRMDVQAIQAEEADMVITGSGKMRIDELKTARTKLGITGAGNIRFQKLDTESMQTRISGSGDIELDGKTIEQELTISAAGKYQARDFESERAKIKISGSGTAWLSVKERLDARISGSGSIFYTGRPIIVQSISGAGKVKYIEE
jgi:hypothetical protein